MAIKRNDNILLWNTLTGTFAFVIAVIGFIQVLGGQEAGQNGVSGAERVFTVLGLGVFSSIIYGVLWSLAEKLFGDSIGEATRLPKGCEASILSLSLTIPLTFIPPIYQMTSGRLIVGQHYFYACFWMNVWSIFGHFIWYGSRKPSFIGIRNLVFPIGAALNFTRYASMEFLATLMHFSTIALVFNYVSGRLDVHGGFIICMGALLFFTGIITFSVVRYPEALVDKTWAQLRGTVAGMILSVALVGTIVI